jgi:hypothetical protein
MTIIHLGKSSILHHFHGGQRVFFQTGKVGRNRVAGHEILRKLGGWSLGRLRRGGNRFPVMRLHVIPKNVYRFSRGMNGFALACVEAGDLDRLHAVPSLAVVKKHVSSRAPVSGEGEPGTVGGPGTALGVVGLKAGQRPVEVRREAFLAALARLPAHEGPRIDRRLHLVVAPALGDVEGLGLESEHAVRGVNDGQGVAGRRHVELARGLGCLFSFLGHGGEGEHGRPCLPRQILAGHRYGRDTFRLGGMSINLAEAHAGQLEIVDHHQRRLVGSAGLGRRAPGREIAHAHSESGLPNFEPLALAGEIGVQGYGYALRVLRRKLARFDLSGVETQPPGYGVLHHLLAAHLVAHIECRVSFGGRMVESLGRDRGLARLRRSEKNVETTTAPPAVQEPCEFGKRSLHRVPVIPGERCKQLAPEIGKRTGSILS